MDYDETVPDWDADDLPQRARLDARLQEMLIQHLDNDPKWPTTVGGLADDLVANDEVRKMLTRFCTIVGNMAVWCAGSHEEAVDGMRQTLEELYTIARKAYS